MPNFLEAPESGHFSRQGISHREGVKKAGERDGDKRQRMQSCARGRAAGRKTGKKERVGRK